MQRQWIRNQRRRGLSAVQWCLIVGAIVLVMVVGIGALGTSVRDDMNTTAGDVADPAQLKNRFGP